MTYKLPNNRVVTEGELPSVGQLVSVASWSALRGEVTDVRVNNGIAEVDVQFALKLHTDTFRYYIKETT